MAARERWLRGVGAQLDLRGATIFRGGSPGVPALRSPEAETELEAEKEDVNTPNIAVSDYCATRIWDS